MNLEKEIQKHQTQIFDHFYHRFLMTFVEKLKQRMIQLNSSTHVNTNHILLQAALDLKMDLIAISHKTLLHEMYRQKKEGTLLGENSAARYECFNQSLLQGSTQEQLFMKYPLLKKLIEKKVESYYQLISESLAYLIEDKAKIERKFSLPFQQVTGINLKNGDSHNGGKMVIAYELDQKNYVIYKPHTLAPEQSYYQFIQYLNHTKQLKYPLKNAQVIDQGTYGWQEYITFSECETKEQVQRYFYRIGASLSLFSLLQTSDLHHENVIASGEFPMFIDLETLMTNKKIMHSNHLLSHFYDEVNSSVIGTMLLPHQFFNGLFDLDLSGLTGGNSQSKTIETQQLINLGTDEMKLDTVYAESGRGINQVYLNGQVQFPTMYLREMILGMEDCFKMILENREDLVCQIEKEQLIYGKYRQVLRPTHVYSKYLESSYHPDYLTSFISRKNLFDIIKEQKTPSENTAQQRQLEWVDLMNDDIPYFINSFEGTELQNGGQKWIDNYYPESLKDRTIAKIKQLDHHYIYKQITLVKQSMALFSYNRSLPYNNQLIEEEDSPKAYAESIGKHFLRTAIWDKTGEKCTWLSLEPKMEHLAFSSMGTSFYTSAGIIWFLAVLGKDTNNESYTYLAKAALKGLEEMHPTANKTENISAFAGSSSLIYLYYNLGILWKEPKLIEISKQKIAQLVTSNYQHSAIDYVTGLAGIIHLLLNIYVVEGDKSILMIADMLGETLYEKLEEKTDFLTGLAHGLSGFGLALSQLYQQTDKIKYQKLGKKLLQLEDVHFNQENHNWQDMRDLENEKQKMFWCYGAPGIVLARKQVESGGIVSEYTSLGMEKLLGDNDDTANSSLCHGELGNLDILQILSDASKNKVFKERAAAKIAQFLQKFNSKQVSDGLYLGESLDGFMTGLAGIGYTLLRLENTNFPSILNLGLMKGVRK